LAQQQEEKELPIIDQSKLRAQRPLTHSNQHMPSQELKQRHQYQYYKEKLFKTQRDQTIAVVAFCAIGYLISYIWIAIAFPAGSMYASSSSFVGGFTPNICLNITAIAGFGMLGIFLIERINPDIARKLQEKNYRTYP
jgi:hypothetical protein